MKVPVIVIKNDDGSFTVVGSGLNFTTEGKTLEEALKNAQEAAECSLEGMQKDADQEDYLQKLDQSFSTFISIPDAVHS